MFRVFCAQTLTRDRQRTLKKFYVWQNRGCIYLGSRSVHQPKCRQGSPDMSISNSYKFGKFAFNSARKPFDFIGLEYFLHQISELYNSDRTPIQTLMQDRLTRSQYKVTVITLKFAIQKLLALLTRLKRRLLLI